jgi:hypothetical protein
MLLLICGAGNITLSTSEEDKMADKEAEPSKDAGQPKLLTHQPNSERWPSADYAYTDGYQHGYYAGQQSTTIKDEETTMDGINSDKVSINLGGEGGGGAGAMAALVAALGNRNQGNDNAALIAALGGRNESRSDVGLLAALMNGRDRHDDGGMNSMWPILLLALLGRRGGFGGGDDGGEVERPVFNAAVLGKLGNIEGQIPNVALQTQNALQGALAQLALGVSQGFAQTGDRIQNSTYLLSKELCDVNQNVSSQGCQTREVVQAGTQAVLSRIDGNRIAELESQIARMHSHDHVRDSEIRISQTVNTNQAQNQQQAQLQAQFDNLNRRLGGIEYEQNQIARATNANLIIGNTGATTTGAQTASPINVRS